MICAGGYLPILNRRADLMGMPAPTVWTAEMVRALPDDGNRYEVVDGELLVTPSPRPLHQHAVTQLVQPLDAYARRIGLGQALVSPSDIQLDQYGLVQPDLFVQGLVDGKPVTEWNHGARLLLVVEVLSPSAAILLRPAWPSAPTTAVPSCSSPPGWSRDTRRSSCRRSRASADRTPPSACRDNPSPAACR